MKKMVLMTTSALALTVTTGAGAQTAQNGPIASIYFLDKTGDGAVSVWVDGRKIIDSTFVWTATVNPRQLRAGTHEVIVTPFYLQPGVKDVARATLNIPPGISTIQVTNLPSTAFSRTSFLVPTLWVSAGAPR